MKIALLHPWFLGIGGAEQVVDVLAMAYPEAECFTLLYDWLHLPTHLRGVTMYALSINWLPAKYYYYRQLLPFWPMAVESIDLRGYDLIISSDSSVMKGVLVDQDATHVCYCHSPMRCLWDLHAEYYEAMPRAVRPIFAMATHYLRQWDFQAAQRVDHFVANSKYIQQRIKKYYCRNSTVIYPPVATAKGWIAEKTQDYYLSVGRLTATKQIDLLVKACTQLKRHLIIVGTGRKEKDLKAIAGPTIEFLGRVPDEELPSLYANCRAFLFAADEDFGIAPVEAQAYGRPVIAYRHGGSLETVRSGDLKGRSDTGVFFLQQTVESVMDGIRCFESVENRFVPQEIQQHARQFDTSMFIDKFRAFIDDTIAKNRSAGK